MMLPTHVILGMLLVTPVITVFDTSIGLLYGTIIGSILPDLDLLVGEHRKTLHFPIYSLVFLLGAVIVGILYPITEIVFVCGVIFGYTVHSLSDVLGSGLEVRPWERTSDKAVYNHYTQNWERPTHYLSYDGSPTDLTVLLLGSAILWSSLVRTLSIPYIQEVLLLSIGIGIVYTISRRLLPAIDKWLYIHVEWIRPLLDLIRDSNRVVSREDQQTEFKD